MEERIQELLRELTIEEKIALTVGASTWSTHAVERLGIPAINLNDGPHGVRKPESDSDSGLTHATPATCFPTASALASSWDTGLIRQVGEALGQECLALDVQVLLGPGTNLKRSPLGGRNFEYFSEDPVLAGEMAAAWIQGVQSKGVGTSLKHYVCNDQETHRMTINAQVDPQTLREVYLLPFERAVKKASPWTIMAAYNQVNGVRAVEHPELLREILKGEWGYDGVVVSDWFAVNKREDALSGGLDLEMPGTPAVNAENPRLAQLVRDGLLSEEVLDEAVARILRLIFRTTAQRNSGATFDKEAHHALARKVASECVVLLKNEDNLLPLEPEKLSSIAILGRFAKHPRFQGGGSSHVTPTKLECAYDELTALLGDAVKVHYADGYPEEDRVDETLLREAAEVAKAADVAVVFIGLPDAYEVEGMDRKHIDLPPSHNRLVEEICRVQPNTVVVLSNGSAVAMPWVDRPKAILEGWLGGQAGGGAVADVLLGRVNPSGKLSETFPVRLEDTPAYLNFPGDGHNVRYGEGVFVGYRYYEKKGIKPLFPFGHGLSYTTFEYSDLRLSKDVITDQDELKVTVKVRNTGNRAGKEVVQLYVRDVEATVPRPEKELKAFAKVSLEPGEAKDVELVLTGRDFAYYDAARSMWYVEAGEFEILVGASSADIRCRAVVIVESTQPKPGFHEFTTLSEILQYPEAVEVIRQLMPHAAPTEIQDASVAAIMLNIPLAKLVKMGLIPSEEELRSLVQRFNEAVHGLKPSA